MSEIRYRELVEPPDDPWARHEFLRGNRYAALGQSLPIPWVRSWLRREGARLRWRFGTEVTREVQPTEWRHEPLFLTIDIRDLETTWWQRVRWKVGTWVENRRVALELALEEKLDREIDLSGAGLRSELRRWAEQRGIW